MAPIEALKDWHRRCTAESRAFRAAEAEFGPALAVGGDRLFSELEELRVTSQSLHRWLKNSPCPNQEVGDHLTAIVGGYVEVCNEMLAFLEGTSTEDEETVVRRVEALRATIGEHEAAIDRWQP